MRGIFCGAALLLSISLAFGQSEKPRWTIGYKGVTDGQPAYTAVHAANELAAYMSRVLGTEVKSAPWDKADAQTLFLVTDAQHAPREIAAELDGKALDAFAIKYPCVVDGKTACVLVSHDELGYDYPAYYFLTRFMGVEWVGPGEIGKVIPENPAWTMPANISLVEEPDFPAMRFWGTDEFTCRQWLAGSLRLGFNHALGGVFPPDTYKDQPDLYPLVEGKRYIPPANSLYAGWQPCTGNPKVVEIAARHVLATLEQDPRQVSVSLSVNDGGGNYCTCPLCRAQDSADAFSNPGDYPRLSDRFFRFYNAVAERVVAQKPDAYITVLGYGPLTGTPPHEVKIHPHILVCKTGPVTGSGGIADQGWVAAGARAFVSWQYCFQGGFLVLRQYPHMLADEVRALKASGGIGLYCSPDGAWAEAAPYMYVLSHLLWDTKQDVDALLDRYMTLAFGEQAAPAMRRYYGVWEEIYERGPRDTRGDMMQGWRTPEQFENFRQSDLDRLNALLAEAQKATATAPQRERLKLVATYHEWLRLNLEQMLFARALNDRTWTGSRRDEDVLAAVAAHAGLTERIDAMWRDTIFADRTSWLTVSRFHKTKPEDYYNYYLRPLRGGIVSAQETAVDDLMESMTLKLLYAEGKREAKAFWKSQLAQYQQLEGFIGPQINLVGGQRTNNLVVNPGFEKGEDGNPPKLPGWVPYQVFGGAKGVPPSYSWKDGSGRTGGRAIGILEGLYEEWRTDPMKLDAGRYRCTYWMRTVNRPYVTNFWLLKREHTQLRPGECEYDHVGVLSFNDPQTNGEWHRVSRTFTLSEPGQYMIQLGSSWQGKGCETYFDDVELVKIW